MAAFEPVSWDEALDTVAAAFRSAIDQFGSESLWPYHYAGTMGLAHGIDPLIDAMHLLSNEQGVPTLLMLGSGSERARLERPSEQTKLARPSYDGVARRRGGLLAEREELWLDLELLLRCVAEPLGVD